MWFADRKQAGRMLAERLAEHPLTDPVVLGLPRGGVPVAVEVARVLDAPLDVLVVRKLGFPGHEEFAMGAVGEDGARVLDQRVAAGVAPRDLEQIETRETMEIGQRVARFRDRRPAVDLRGRTAIIVDDGVATGATARAACAIARARGAAVIVLAVPVAAPDSLAELADAADEIVCLYAPAGFMAVGMHYVDFRQVEDAEVIRLLRSAE
ncbi:phosphoribosyltransferase [Microbacterium sp. LWH12-1.2]|uniref:phosphoribosyltransferase n=1 Tax=Microbacterium sp. LWH12-1.2 TaxID=3135259 RepID=UPI00343A4A38